MKPPSRILEGPLSSRVMLFIRTRSDILILGALLLGATVLLPRSIPVSLYGLGIVGGAGLALHVIGVILLYRSNRIINIAQVQFGAVAATTFVVLVRYAPLFRLVNSVCPGCITEVTPTVYAVNFVISLILSFGLALGIGFVVYILIVKRFASAPRLVLTVATIFLAEALAGMAAVIPNLLTTADERESGLQFGAISPPFDFSMSLGSGRTATRLSETEILTVVLAALAVTGLLVYLKRSRTGIAIRAASENPVRTATVGVNVDLVLSRVWMISAGLSALAGVLLAIGVGSGGEATLNVSTLVRILGIAVIARLSSLAIAAAGAVVLGIAEQAVLWNFRSSVILDGILLFIIAAAMLLQRFRATKAETEQPSAWRLVREVRPISQQLRQLSVVKKWQRWGGLIGGAALLGSPWLMSPSQTNLGAVIMIYAIVGMSLLILTGWAGQVSLGQFALAAVGAYLVALLRLPFLLELILAGFGGSLAALIIGLPALRLRGLNLALITLAFSLSVVTFLLNPSYLGGSLPPTIDPPTLLGMELRDQRVFYYFTLAILVMVIIGVYGIRRSRIARALIGARENEAAAQAFGINITRVRLTAFAASGFLAGLAGGLFAFHQHGVRAAAFAPETSVSMFLGAVVGGLGSISGPLIGAVYLGFLLLSSSVQAVFLVSGVGGLSLLFLAPGGLGQLFFDARDSVLRWIARRHRIELPGLASQLRDERAPLPVERRDRPEFVPERYRLDGQWAASMGEGEMETVSPTGQKAGRGG